MSGTSKAPNQPVQILMRMQRRHAQQISLRLSPFRDLEKLPLHPVMNHRRVAPVVAPQILPRRLRHRDQPRRPPRRSPQQRIPERQIEPAKMLRMPLVLQVVEHGHRRARRKPRTREPRIEQHLDPSPLRLRHQPRLLKNNPPRPVRRPHRLRRVNEILPPRNQILPRLAIGEHEIPVLPVHLRQRRQQVSQIDLRAAHPAGNEVQRVDPDPPHRRVA